MFEQPIEDLVLTIYFDDKGVEACQHNGVRIERGDHRVTYAEAVALVTQMQALFPSVPKYQQARFRATMNSIKTAFGPEFWERYP